MRAVDTALLVVDMQERLLALIPDADRVTWNCRRLIRGARILGVSVSATEQNPSKLGPTAKEVAEGLERPPLAKMAFSCGECGELHPHWQAAGIDRVLLCGIETHVCVQQTALDLLSTGYRVYIASDAVGSRSHVDDWAALHRMESSGAVITTTEAALFEWCERAGTDEFRAISALVKELPPEV
jgi:nicotinamidase-related amidase